jgi:hypothetical protein
VRLLGLPDLAGPEAGAAFFARGFGLVSAAVAIGVFLAFVSG